MLAPASVAPRAQRPGSRSVPRTAPGAVRTDTTPARSRADGDTQQLLFDPDRRPHADDLARHGDAHDTAAGPGVQALLPFGVQRSGHARDRPMPPAFEQPCRRVSDFTEPDESPRVGLREVVDSLTILVMAMSLGGFLLLSIGTGVWVIKSLLGVDVIPTAHASEVLLGIAHDAPAVGGAAGSSVGTDLGIDLGLGGAGGASGAEFPMLTLLEGLESGGPAGQR